MLTDTFAHNAQRGRVEKNPFRVCLFLERDPSDDYLTAVACPARTFDGRRFERSENPYPIFGPTDSPEWRERFSWHDEPYTEDAGDGVTVVPVVNGEYDPDYAEDAALDLYTSVRYAVCVNGACLAQFPDVYRANMLARGLANAARPVETSRLQ